jgi:hypothetical protein
MKISRNELKKLVEQELKEVDFGLTSPMDARIQATRAKKKKEREELGAADTVKAEPLQRQGKETSTREVEPTQQQDKFNTGDLRDMDEEDRQLYFDAQGKGEFAADPEKMRLAVIRLLRNKYNI